MNDIHKAAAILGIAGLMLLLFAFASDKVAQPLPSKCPLGYALLVQRGAPNICIPGIYPK